MNSFPENFELESFFEREPEVLDEGVPWEYNRLTFNVEASNGRLSAVIEMGSEIMSVVWTQGEYEVLNLNLVGVMSMQVVDEKKYDTLILKFRNQDVKDLILKIRPVISVAWGYDDHP